MLRFSVLALILLAAGPVHAAEKTLDRTFTVSPGGSLVVDADGASIRVTGTDSNQVTVHMRVRGSEKDLADLTLDAVQSGNQVTATMRREKSGKWFNWGSWTAESSIEVRVPKRFEVNARTGGGEIDVSDTVGAVKLNTSGGDIDVRNVNGATWLRTSGGKIAAEGVQGDLDANTSGGDVELLAIDGAIKAHTSGGSVRVALKGANRGIRASTSGGDVEVVLPRDARGNVLATTSGGDIKTDIPVTTTKVSDSRLEGTLNGGGPSIEATTSGGDIRLRQAN